MAALLYINDGRGKKAEQWVGKGQLGRNLLEKQLERNHRTSAFFKTDFLIMNEQHAE